MGEREGVAAVSFDVAAAARRFAPTVVLDREEQLFPISADDFIARSELRWAGGQGPTITPVRPGRLGYGEDGYQTVPEDEAHAPIAASRHTRPYDAFKRDPVSLPLSHGWTLSLKAYEDAVGTAPRAMDGSVYSGVPVYYEHIHGYGRDYILYWFCYAGSALQRAIIEALRLRHLEGVTREEGLAFEEQPPPPE